MPAAATLKRIRTDDEGQTEMTAAFTRIANAAAYLPRLLLIVAALSAPVLAMPHVQASGGAVIEHAAKKSNGVGFVLLVSLQR